MRVVAVDGQPVHPDASTPTGLTLSEAASALSTTPEAVRKRIARGSLLAEKVDGRWRVHLPIRSDVPPADHPPSSSADPTPTRTPDAHPDAAVQQLVELLRDQVAHLRDLIDRRDAELARLGELGGRQSQTIAELASAIAELRQSRPRRSWWPW